MSDEPSNKVLYPKSKLAIAALVLGVLAIWPFGILAAIPAIICGHAALREIKAAKGEKAGAAYAKFGLVVGYVMFGILVITAITSQIVLHQLAHQVHDTFQLQSAQSSH